MIRARAGVMVSVKARTRVMVIARASAGLGLGLRVMLMDADAPGFSVLNEPRPAQVACIQNPSAHRGSRAHDDPLFLTHANHLSLIDEVVRCSDDSAAQCVPTHRLRPLMMFWSIERGCSAPISGLTVLRGKTAARRSRSMSARQTTHVDLHQPYLTAPMDVAQAKNATLQAYYYSAYAAVRAYCPGCYVMIAPRTADQV